MNIAGGPAVENPPTNAGDVGSAPGLRRRHMLRGNQAPQLLSCALEPAGCNYRAHPPQLLSLCALESLSATRGATSMRSPSTTTRESWSTATETQCSQKKNYIYIHTLLISFHFLQCYLYTPKFLTYITKTCQGRIHSLGKGTLADKQASSPI